MVTEAAMPSGESKPAPMPLLLVQSFVNTLDVEAGTDLLAEPDPALRWFAAAGLLTERVDLTPDDLRLAREVRENIRALLAGTPAGELQPLSWLAERSTPRLRLDAAGAVHVDAPPGAGLDGVWLRLLLIIRAAQADHTWQRLKACANHGCEWAFYDRSRSGRGRWCDMAVCGNRSKNRALRRRKAGPAQS